MTAPAMLAKEMAFKRGLYRIILRMRLRFLKPRLARVRIEYLRGVAILVLPTVFDGILTRTGAFLVETIADEKFAAGTRVLDLGCGTGIGAVFAAQRGAHVVATDLNAEAARNTQLNALLSHYESCIETRVGDLFETVSGERFDWILFNPPYYQGAPRDLPDAAWRSLDTFERFLSQLPEHFTPRGRARIVLSTDGDIESKLTGAKHLKIEIVRRGDLGNEILTVYDLFPKT